MTRPHFNILILLSASWTVYGLCQEDMFLPLAAGAIAILSLVLRLKTATKNFVFFEQMPLWAISSIAMLVGILWRSVVPAPENASAPLLSLVAPLQSASIVAAALIVLRPFNQANMYRLFFCAWLTVASSVNVPFTQEMFLAFAAFSLIAVAVIIINTMHRPQDKKYTFMYAKDYVLYSGFLIVATTVLFLGISSMIVIMETAFFNTMGNYILPRHYTHFLNIGPNLNLITPGVSALDKRPIMEITIPRMNGIYLKMQVFDKYNNGTWTEVKDAKKVPLPMGLIPNHTAGKITMFTALKDRIPAPNGITAITSADKPYWQTPDQIIYENNPQYSRIFNFSVAPSHAPPIDLTAEMYARYTEIPGPIAPQLRQIAHTISGDATDPKTKADRLTVYFRRNFGYSLNVDFSADNKGLIKMLENKMPAYCTYFASALTLLLRAEGIPARVAAGLLTTERIEKDKFLARVNNAHAWTEVLLPFHDPVTGKTAYRWRNFDATPPSFNTLVKTPAYYLEIIFEKMWLNLLRLKALVENTDKDRLKIYGVLSLLTLMALMNHRRIISTIKIWLNRKRAPKGIIYKSPDALRLIYTRYEYYIKEKYGEVRALSDTDMDVITRIRKKFPQDADKLETFIKAFHAARFGGKEPPNLMYLLFN